MKRVILPTSLISLLLCSSWVHSSLTLVKVSDVNLGTVLAGPSGRQWIVGTNGTVSGTDSGDYMSGASAGEILLTDSSAPASIQILATNISTIGGLNVNKVTCSYNNGVETQCDQTGMVTTSSVLPTGLKVGVELQSTQHHFGGDNPQVDFDISITYL